MVLQPEIAFLGEELFGNTVKEGCCELGFETSNSIKVFILRLFTPFSYNNNKKATHGRRTALYLKSGSQLHVSAHS
jgi:hypothetical protein